MYRGAMDAFKLGVLQASRPPFWRRQSRSQKQTMGRALAQKASPTSDFLPLDSSLGVFCHPFELPASSASLILFAASPHLECCSSASAPKVLGQSCLSMTFRLSLRLSNLSSCICRSVHTFSLPVFCDGRLFPPLTFARLFLLFPSWGTLAIADSLLTRSHFALAEKPFLLFLPFPFLPFLSCTATVSWL